MHLKRFLEFALLAVTACTLCPAHAQTAPAAKEGQLHLDVGAGLSSFNPDWAQGRMMGTTLWVDWYPTRLPAVLHGLGIESESRALNFNRGGTLGKWAPNLSEYTTGGGLIYHWQHYRNFRPYGKFIVSYGGLTWAKAPVKYRHDTRTVSTYGVGFDYRLPYNVSLRADYEYQMWPDLFGHKRLDPSGFTLGAVYHFGRAHRFQHTNE